MLRGNLRVDCSGAATGCGVDWNIEETSDGLELRINQPYLLQVFLLIIVLFQHESLSELVYTQILALRDCQDVVDLTLDLDSEDSAMPVEPIAKVERPALRDSDRSLVPIEEGHSVGRQRCICSLGRIKQTTPYWAATGVHRDKGELQLLGSGSHSDSASSQE